MAACPSEAKRQLHSPGKEIQALQIAVLCHRVRLPIDEFLIATLVCLCSWKGAAKPSIRGADGGINSTPPARRFRLFRLRYRPIALRLPLERILIATSALLMLLEASGETLVYGYTREQSWVRSLDAELSDKTE